MCLTNRFTTIGAIVAMLRTKYLAVVYTTCFKTSQGKQLLATGRSSSVVGTNPGPFNGFHAVGFAYGLMTLLTLMPARTCVVD